MTTSPAARLDPDGYEILPPILSPSELQSLLAPVDALLEQHTGQGGVRDVLSREPSLKQWALGPLRELAARHLGPGAFPVRGLIFDKTPLANWKTTWHQDVTVSVTEYRETPGWGPWSLKEGTWHVRAPSGVLDGLLTVRLHLDPCGPDNGPVRVVPGTHRLGRLGDEQMAEAARRAAPVDCLVPLSGVLLMRPLLLHASARAVDPRHRRVLHVEYAAAPLPDGFEWARQWSDA